MGRARSSPFLGLANPDSPFYTGILACLVAALSYLAARLGGVLTLHPQTLCPLWPACALLVSVLLLVPRRIWPALILAAFAAFVVYDLQTGLTIRSTVWLILADTVEVLIAALCVSYSFDGVPRLNSVKALAKYSFFAVILAPFAGAFLGAAALNGDYWINWRIGFFSEALAFLTLTPAILSWVSEARPVVPKIARRIPRSNCADRCVGSSRIFHVRRFRDKRSSSTALFSDPISAVVWFAFRSDRSLDFGDCSCLSVDLGRRARSRSLHRTSAAQ